MVTADQLKSRAKKITRTNVYFRYSIQPAIPLFFKKASKIVEIDAIDELAGFGFPTVHIAGQSPNAWWSVELFDIL